MKRRIYQVLFLVLLNLPLLGEWKAVCLPVLNCHSCPWAVTACPVGVMGHFAAWGVIPFFALGTIAAAAAVFGRFFCGWMCPFGLLQDGLYKIPSPKWKLKRWLTYVKYVILIGAVVLVPLLIGLNNYGFFCALCPAGTAQSLLPRALSEGDYGALAAGWIRLAVLAGVLALAIVSSRSFCKVFCPIGAFLALFNRFSACSIRYEQEDCPACKQCLKDCPMDVKIEDFRKTDPESDVITAPSECILCLNCTKNCHQSGLSFSLWGLLSRGDRKKSKAKTSNREEQHEPESG